MQNHREENLGRLRKYHLNINDPHYLVYRRLFPDLENAAQHASGRLLDIGCGNKPYEKMFDGRISAYVGCDVVQSDLMKVDVVCPATSIPLGNETFDTVLCTQVIEHVADHKSLLSEAYRLLRNDGTLILSGPMYWPLHEEPYDFFRFTEHGLRYLLEELGFDILSITSNGGKWALFGQALIHTIEKSRFHRRPVIRMINRTFGWIDDKHRDDCNPMNYVVVAIKSSKPLGENQ